MMKFAIVLALISGFTLGLITAAWAIAWNKINQRIDDDAALGDLNDSEIG